MFQDEEAFLDAGDDHDAALENRVVAECAFEHGRIRTKRKRIEVVDLAKRLRIRHVHHAGAASRQK